MKTSSILSVLLVAGTFLLLSPTSDSLSGVSKVYGYGAGLSVDNASVLNGYAIADNTYENGFKFRMRVTVDSPTENKLQAKFADWVKSSGTGTIAVSSNMLTNLANNSSSAVSVGNSYSNTMTVGADLNPTSPGIQNDVYIWLKVPSGTEGGSYSTSYGLLSSTGN